MAKKGHRQKKARAPRKSNRVGLSTTASTHTITVETPKMRETKLDKELKALLGAKITKT